MGLSIGHLLVVLAIVLVIFGTKKLRDFGGDLGGAIKNFKRSLGEEASKAPGSTADPQPRRAALQAPRAARSRDKNRGAKVKHTA